MQFLRAPEDRAPEITLDTHGRSIDDGSTIDESSEERSKGQIKANTPGNKIGPITPQPTNYTIPDSELLGTAEEPKQAHKIQTSIKTAEEIIHTRTDGYPQFHSLLLCTVSFIT